MSDPVTHIARPPLPWRESDLTECGRPAKEFAQVVEWHEARALAKKHGKTRFYMLFCVTCIQTTQRWPTWDSDPLERLLRERRGNEELIQRELRAVAALIAAHWDEFKDYVVGLSETVSLAERRRGNR